MLFVLILLVSGFAVWSITSLLVNERGPANIFGRIRNLAGVIDARKADGELLNLWLEKNPWAEPEDVPDKFAFNEIGRILACFWCASMWVSFATAGYLLWAGHVDLVIAPVMAFALRGFSILVDEYIHGQK